MVLEALELLEVARSVAEMEEDGHAVSGCCRALRLDRMAIAIVRVYIVVCGISWIDSSIVGWSISRLPGSPINIALFM